LNPDKTLSEGVNIFGMQKKTDKTDDITLNNDLLLAEWYKGLRETNNAKFVPLFFDQHRYLILKGGGGSGKSIFAGRKILERCVAENGHRFLVCRKVGKTIRNSCFTQLVGQIADYYPDVQTKINRGDMAIYFPETKSEILFSGLDDVEKLKSIYNITGIWIEEASELLESDFNQLDIRLRGETEHYKQIILSFNPISIVHWLKLRFFDQTDERAYIHETTYKDNRFLDEDAIRTLEAFKDTDEYYYDVYCLGNWGVTGKSVFDGRAISRRLTEIRPPKLIGIMHDDTEDIAFEDDRNGFIKVYAEPNERRPYVIGGDTAGDGSDACVLQVLDAISGEQVAILRSADMDEDLFARQCYCLGRWYNDALIAIEANLSTFPIRELERLRYPRQFVREQFDDLTHKVKMSFGFRTDMKTRPVIISDLVRLVREHVELINDRTTLEEMLSFIRNPETYKPEAEEGAHDDCVMALAIALFARNSGQIKLKEIVRQTEVEWTEDMKEDYRVANKEDRRLMIERWGKPKGGIL